MVSTSYPGVYVQEIPSGVRSIAGVSTSIAMFLGRTQAGQVNQPVQCLSYEDFVRAFGEDSSRSDTARAVKLFFGNGGTQCYAMRIARGAVASKVTLQSEGKTSTLVVKAKSEGSFGDEIRVAVSYSANNPESTFNLQVFRWTKASNGSRQKSQVETYTGLSMDPSHPRYVVDVLATASSLVDIQDLKITNLGTAKGYSQSGFAVSAGDGASAVTHTQWSALIGKTSTTNRFRISVDGNAPVEVDLSSLDFSVAPLNNTAGVLASLPGAIAAVINAKLPASSSVTVTLETGPAGTGLAGKDNEKTHLLRISSANGDVRITPASTNDLAAKLMLGTGGLEVSRYAAARPAPNGYVLNLTDAAAFAKLAQAAFNGIRIDGTVIDLSAAPYKLATTGVAVSAPCMYQDAGATNQNDGRGGLREKLAILASAINAKRAADSSFSYAAEVWGDRLAIIPLAEIDNQLPKVELLTMGTPPTVASAVLKASDNNVRYYSLGNGALGYQTGALPGGEGTAPKGDDYEAAYQVIDREVDLFNLMVLPKDVDHADADRRALWGPASSFCQKRRAFLIMDPPDAWTTSQKATDASVGVNSLRLGLVKDHSAVFYPNLKINENGKEVLVGPSGAIAGLMARIDGTRGVWKAPAGTEADLRSVVGVQYKFSDGENGVMNPRGVNTLRVFPNGLVNWGARTLDGDDDFGSEYKYIPIRRLALYMEESLYRGLKWAVFEPNDEPLWSQIRLNVGAFMHTLFKQGAFQGATPKEAYFVKCDASTTTQSDRNLGLVNVVVGFAPLKPAEFIVLYLQQIAGQIQS